MRLSKAEVARRKAAVLTYFRTNPTASVAKMNKALVAGELTGKPERMLNIATGYAWRKEAVATPELPLAGLTTADTVPMPTPPPLKDALDPLIKALEAGGYSAAPGELKQGCELKVESLDPVIETVVRTGPVALGGNGEDPAAVAADIASRNAQTILAAFPEKKE